MSTATLAPASTGLAFRVEPKPFAAVTSWVAKRLPVRPAVPTLGGILLEVVDGRLSVSGFDYDVASLATIDCAGDDGRALVSGRLLAELVKTFPDKPVDVTLADGRVVMKCGGVQVALPAMPVEEYPTLPALPPAIGSIAAADLVSVVERVATAADRDGSAALPALTGVLLRFGPDGVEAMATDRYRATVAAVDWVPAGGDEVRALVIGTILTDVARAFDGQPGNVQIHLDGGLIGFAGVGRSIVVRQLAEEHPGDLQMRMKTLFPQPSETPCVVDVAELATALRRVDLVRAPKSPAVLTLGSEGLTVAAKDEDGPTAGETLACDYTGPDITVSVNPQFLLDGLAALNGPTAEISVAPKRPFLLTAGAETYSTFRYMISPVRSTR